MRSDPSGLQGTVVDEKRATGDGREGLKRKGKEGLEGQFVLQEGRSTSELCTFHIGGPATVVSTARDELTMAALARYARFDELGFSYLQSSKDLQGA